MKQWSDEVHHLFVEIYGYMNRPDIDVAFLERAGVKLASALFPLLSRIGVLAPIGVVDLAHAAGRDHSTISRQVAKLEWLGLVERGADAGDQRVKLVRPTAAGRDMLAQFSKVRQDVMEQCFTHWTAEEWAEFVRLLRKMRADLGRFDAKPKGISPLA